MSSGSRRWSDDGTGCPICGLPHPKNDCNYECPTCGLVGVHNQASCDHKCRRCQGNHLESNCNAPRCTICGLYGHWQYSCDAAGPYAGSSLFKGPNTCCLCNGPHGLGGCPLMAEKKK